MLICDWPQRVLASVALALLVPTTTSVYAQQSGRIRGEVEKADGAVLSLSFVTAAWSTPGWPRTRALRRL